MNKTTLVSLACAAAAASSLTFAQVTVAPGQDPNPRVAPPPNPSSVASKAGVSVFTVPQVAKQAAGVDYANAKPLPLPRAPARSQLQSHYDLMDSLAPRAAALQPGFSPGHKGTGIIKPVNLGTPNVGSMQSERVVPQDFGTNEHAFTTARADLGTVPAEHYYPFRASGKLFFNIGGSSHWCSAALIKRGVVVTAAHCVALYGAQVFYSGWSFVPGYRNGVALTQPWSVRSVVVMTGYLNGTDSCLDGGVICPSDIALLLLNDQTGAYPGTALGWYAYGWDGYGFTSAGLAQITQLGYPFCLDRGLLMERNDSYAYTAASLVGNNVIGTLMCEGSSGGPWLVNFGVQPLLNQTATGAAGEPNTIVGVTSWGYNTTGPKEAGASPFSSANIVMLVNTTCSEIPAACL